MKNGIRVSWSEVREEEQGYLEMFYVIAEQTSTGWTFYERSSWELRWYPIPSTKALVRRAFAEAAKQNREQPKKESNYITMRRTA